MDTSTPSEPRATLRWSPEDGFELDFEAATDDVSLRMVGVPVPADGTVELREGVELFKLEILFKAVVDVEGAPGQLQEATLTLVGDDRLRLQAVVEDAESGLTQDLSVEAPVALPRQAPERGGPRPKAPEEDDLDWEDEQTFEQMFGDVSMPVSDREPEEPPAAPKKGGGLAALLKAIAGAADDEPDAAEPAAPEPAGAPAAPPAAVDAAPDFAEDQVMSLDREALSFLQLLVDREQLELTEGHDVSELAPGIAPLLGSRRSPDAKAAAVSDWLLDQDAVEELYIDDESLAALLDQW